MVNTCPRYPCFISTVAPRRLRRSSPRIPSLFIYHWQHKIYGSLILAQVNVCFNCSSHLQWAACTVAPISPRLQSSSSYVAWFSTIPACKRSIASSPITVRPPLGYQLPVCKILSGLKRCNVTVHTSALWVGESELCIGK